jgi:UDP-glucose 4-epimerase
MKIVISGSEGFIGKRLKTAFQSNCDDEIISLDIINGHDLCKADTLNNIKPFDVFIHLAGLSYVPDSFRTPKKFYDVNISSTLNVLELCRKFKAKMIFISSYVYGNPEYLPIDENHPLKAFNPYAQSKIIGEQLCEGYYRDFGVGCIILRPFNIYGDGQNKSFILPSIVNQIKSGKKLIKLMDPDPRRDYIHVDDVVRAIQLCSNHIKETDGQLSQYNVASGKSYSVREVTELIASFGVRLKEIQFEFTPQEVRKNEVNETLGSYGKINCEIGWKPEISLAEGLKNWLGKEY